MKQVYQQARSEIQSNDSEKNTLQKQQTQTLKNISINVDHKFVIIDIKKRRLLH